MKKGVLPKSLTYLVCGQNFNQPVDPDVLRSLTVFEVGPRYNQWPVDVVQGVLFRSECQIMHGDVRIQFREGRCVSFYSGGDHDLYNLQ